MSLSLSPATHILSALSHSMTVIRLAGAFINSNPLQQALRDLDTAINDVANLIKPAHDEAVRLSQQNAQNNPQPQPPPPPAEPSPHPLY